MAAGGYGLDSGRGTTKSGSGSGCGGVGWGESTLGSLGREERWRRTLRCVLRSVRGKGTKVANSDLPSEAIMKSLSGDGLAGATRGGSDVENGEHRHNDQFE